MTKENNKESEKENGNQEFEEAAEVKYKSKSK